MNRTEPRATEEKIEALRARYQEGQFSEIVFRASLYAIGLRGDDISQIVRDTPPPERKSHGDWQ